MISKNKCLGIVLGNTEVCISLLGLVEHIEVYRIRLCKFVLSFPLK